MSQISNINFKKSVELAKNRTETALETQNEPKARQEPSQELKTQETAPKAKSQATKVKKTRKINERSSRIK